MKRNMKRAMAVVLAATLMMTGTALASTPNAKEQIVASDQYIAVNASGTIEVQPDIASISLGVMTTAKDSAQARQKNANTLKKVTQAIEKAGVKGTDIKTEHISMYPNSDFKNGSEIITGYTVTNQLSITVQNVDKAGEIINAAMTAGANTVNGISYDVKDREKYYEQAVDKAMKSANSKAKIMANASGLKLGNVLNIREGSYDYMPIPTVMYSKVEQAESAVAGNIGDTLKPSLVTISVDIAVMYSAK